MSHPTNPLLARQQQREEQAYCKGYAAGMRAQGVYAENLRGLVDKAVHVMQRHAPPDGLSDRDALSELYGIFDGPEYRAAIAAGCPTCKGTGWITSHHPGSDEEFQCSCPDCSDGMTDFVHEINSAPTVLDPPMFGELEAYLRERKDMGEYDTNVLDPTHIRAADAIRDLRVALASQIEISNDLRRQIESRTQSGTHTTESFETTRDQLACWLGWEAASRKKPGSTERDMLNRWAWWVKALLPPTDTRHQVNNESSFWLIEGPDGKSFYAGGAVAHPMDANRHWTSYAPEALRFTGAAHAQRFINTVGVPGPCAIREHLFMSSDSRTVADTKREGA